MKLRSIIIAALLLTVASCSITSDGAVGTYTGSYVYNSSVYSNITAAVGKESDNTVNLLFSGIGISDLSVTAIKVTVDGSTYIMSKAVGSETLSGVVQGNNINITYSNSGTDYSFVGTK